MREEKDKMREEILSKREPGLYVLGISQPLQIVKGTKIRRFTFREVWSGEKAQDVAGQPFVTVLEGIKVHSIQLCSRLFEEIKYVTDELSQISYEKPKVEIDYLGNTCEGIFCSVE